MLVLNILEKYINFTMIYHFYQIDWILKKSKNFQLIDIKKWIFYIHNKFKTGINLWVSDSVYWKCLTKTIYWYEHRSKKRKKKWFWIFFFFFFFWSWWIMLFWEKLWQMLKHRDMKLVTKERGRNYLVYEPNYQTAKFFTKIY